MKKIYCLFFIMILSFSCSKIFLKRFTFKRQDNNSNALNLNGYYYEEYSPSEKYIYIFFKNGVIVKVGAIDTSEIIELENKFKDGSYYNEIKSDYSKWGIYKIDGTDLTIEIRQLDWGRYVMGYKGTILSDTNYQLNSEYDVRRKKQKGLREINVKGYFKPFSPKPDSTNKFTD